MIVVLHEQNGSMREIEVETRPNEIPDRRLVYPHADGNRIYEHSGNDADGRRVYRHMSTERA